MFDNIVAVTKLRHSEKALLPIDVTLLGITILVKLKPSWIHRPVASTLFFCCKYDMSIVKAQIAQLMVDEAFYILTEAKINSEDKVVMSWVKDPELEKSFKRECDQIQNKDKC